MITRRIMRVLRNAGFLHVMVLVFILGFLVGAPPWAHADIPRYINYQGKLVDAEDNPVTGDVSITMRIYDAATEGTLLWEETQAVTVTRGIFSMLLGSTTSLAEEDSELDFNDPYWYSVEVASDGEMTPRQRLTTIAYAINADKLDGYDATDFLKTAPDGDLSLTGGANENIEINPTGTGNVVITIDSTSGDFKVTDGTTDWLLVDSETGNVTIAGTLNMSTKRIINLATPFSTTDAVTKAYVDALVPASAGGWTDGGTDVYLSTSTDSVGIGTTSTGTYKLNVAGTINATDLYIDGSQISSTDLSDASSIAMLDEDETITGNWTVSGVTIDNSVIGGTTAAAATFTQITMNDGSATDTLTYDSTQGYPFNFSDKVSVEDIEIRGSSPAVLTFGQGDNKTKLIYDPATDEIRFSRGTFSQQFRNLIKNASFEAFSAFEDFHGYDTTYATDTTVWDKDVGYQGGWDNFAPDDWTYVSGKVFQHSPLFFRDDFTAASITDTTYKRDTAEGRSAVRLAAATVDSVTTAGKISQTISGLKPSTVYSVGVKMRIDAGGSAKIDIENEDGEVPNPLPDNTTNAFTVLAAQLGPTDTSISAGSVANFPVYGTVQITTGATTERIRYEGLDAEDNKFLKCTRGSNATTHSINTKVIVAPFVAQTITSAGDTNYIRKEGQFATDRKATSVNIVLSAEAGAAYFDTVQIVAGGTVPEYSPGSIVDTGDQTLYGTLRIGRSSDEKGGILAVDQVIRTRGIDFFEDDPGISGTTGGGGTIDQPWTVPNVLDSAIWPKVYLKTSGNYVDPTIRKFQVQLLGTSIASPTGYMRYRYKDCIDPMRDWEDSAYSPSTWDACTWYATDVNGASLQIPIAIDQVVQEVEIAFGIKLSFDRGWDVENSAGFQSGDAYEFKAFGMSPEMMTYDAFDKDATYRPGSARIYKDPETGELTFEDSKAGKVRLAEIISQSSAGYVSPPVRDTYNTGAMVITASGDLNASEFSSEKNFEVGIEYGDPPKFWWNIRQDWATGTYTQWYGNWGQSFTQGSPVTLIATGPDGMQDTGDDVDTGIDITFPAGTYYSSERWTFYATPGSESNVAEHSHTTGPFAAPGTSSNTWTVGTDKDPSTTDITLNFGQVASNRYIKWDYDGGGGGTGWFDVQGDVNITGTLSATNLSGTTSTSGTANDSFTIDTDDSATSPTLTFGTYASGVASPKIVTQEGPLTLEPVAGSGVNIDLATTGDFAVNTNQLYVDTDAGKVGIGTTGPGYTLDVNGTINATTIKVGETDVLTSYTETDPNAVLTAPVAAASQTIQPTADVVPLTIKGYATGAQNVLSIYDAADPPTEKIYVDSAGHMRIAESTTAGNQDSDATLYFGRNLTDDWETIGYDSSLAIEGSSKTGKFTFSAPLQIEASSPAGITFVETSSGKSRDFMYDPATDTFEFSGGKLKQTFQNLIRNGSFESYRPSGWEYHNTTWATDMEIITDPATAKFDSNYLKAKDTGSTAMGMRYWVPMPDRFIGENLTMSVWACSESGTPTASIGYSYTSGATDAVKVKDISLTTTWQQFSWTFPDAVSSNPVIYVYLYAAGGDNPDSDGVSTTVGTATNTIYAYFDGITLVQGRLSLDYGPTPILDTGNQVLYGNLAIGADSHPYAGGYPSLIFGEPEPSFYYSGYSGWGMESGQISYVNWGGNTGRFMFNKPIRIYPAYGGTYGAGFYVGDSGQVDYANDRIDAYIQGVLEVDGSTYLGDTIADSVTVMGTLEAANLKYTGNLLPAATDSYDIGENATPLEWRNLYIDGIAYLDKTVIQDATGNSLVVDTDTLVVDATNHRVGIGTATPSQKLEVSGGNAYVTGTIRADSDGNYIDLLDGRIETNRTGGLYIQYNKDANVNIHGSDKIFTNYNATSEFMRIKGDTGKVGIGTTVPDYTLEVAGDMGIDDYIYHNDDAHTYIIFQPDRFKIAVGGEWMLDIQEDVSQDRIQLGDGGDIDIDLNNDVFIEGSSGNVGIGTTAPGNLVHIQKDQDATTRLLVENLDDGTSAGSSIYVNADGGGGEFRMLSSTYTTAYMKDRFIMWADSLASGITIATTSASGDIRFHTGYALTDSSYERMRIDEDGNVGIGTTAPGTKLDVNGSLTIRAGNNLIVGANTLTTSDKLDATKVADADLGDLAVSGGAWTLKAGSVAGDELASSGVTLGSYTAADITVDADGRITSAADGTIDLGSEITGTLGIADGGTNATSFTSSELVRMNSGNTALESSGKTIADFLELAGGTMSGDITMGSNTVTGLKTPSLDTDAVTKVYVDNAIAGLKWKESVKATTTAGGILASDFADNDTIDGIPLATGDRILIKDQGLPKENGIYVVTAGQPTRAADANSEAQLIAAAVFVEQGATYGDTAFVCSTDSIATIDADPVNFAQFSGAQAYTWGNGLSNIGSTINVGAGDGITVATDTVALTTPGTLTVSTSNSSASSHTHAVTSSSSPAGTASILASAADGGLQLLLLGLGADPDTDNRITMVDGGQIGQTAGMLIEFDSTDNYLEITGGNVGIGTTAPTVAKLQVLGDTALRSADKIILDSDNGADSYMAHDNSYNYVSLYIDGIECARIKKK